MIQHTALFKFNESTSAGEIGELMTALMGLKNEVSGIERIVSGENFSDRSDGHTHVVSMSFADRATLKAFYDHPAHKRSMPRHSSPSRHSQRSATPCRSTGEHRLLSPRGMTAMVAVEVTRFEVRAGGDRAFRDGLVGALPTLARQRGYIEHEFGVSVEQPSQFWLIVRWETLEDHTEGFRSLADFKEFVGAFREFLNKPAEVSHFISSAHAAVD